MNTVGCVLQAHDMLHESVDTGDFDSPEGLRKLMESEELYRRARIVTVTLTEEQAEKIRARLWPDERLLGATCGRGFSIDTAEQVAAINDILKPEISIEFSPDHKWMLQTWPEQAA